MSFVRRAALVLALSGLAGAAHAASDFALVFASAGEAIFVDLANVKKSGSLARFDYLRVADRPQTIMEIPYAAALQEASIDCEINEFRALSTTKVADDGKAMPKEELRADPYPIAFGTREAGMQAAVCSERPDLPDRAKSIVEAIKMGKAVVAEAKAGAKN